METLTGFLFLFPLFMMAVVIHEVSHGVVADYLGDLTARRAGRLTLNPFRHMDLFGTVLLPLFLQLVHAPFVFGWAKPVPVDYRNLRHPKRDMFWIGAAGPAANFLLAATAALLLKAGGPALPPVLAELLRAVALINIGLGAFNLLPVPPLDGSRVLAGLLPARLAAGLLRLERWGILLVMLLLYFGIIDRVVWPAVAWLARAFGL